jgi:uncharacterized protein DUF4232
MHPPSCSLTRRAGAAAITSTVLLSLIAAPTASPAGRAAASPPPCDVSLLVVWLKTNGTAAGGSVFYRLNFTNLTGRACTMFGYPGVSALDAAGYQLGSSASHDRSRTPRVVRLARNATAWTVLRIVGTGNFSASSCRPVMAAGLRVYPPNGSTIHLIPFPFSACSRTAPTYLTVQAVRS